MKLVVIIMFSVGCVLSHRGVENRCRNYIRQIQRFEDKILTQCSDVVDCGPPEGIANGNVSYTSTTLDSKAIYSCDTDYVFTGSPCDQEAVCGVSETWSEPRGTCELAGCGTPPNGESVKVVFTETTFGANATYSCMDEDLVIAGPCEAMCEEDSGMWSAVGPCVPVYFGCKINFNGLAGAYELDVSVFNRFCQILILSPDITRPRRVNIKLSVYSVASLLEITVDSSIDVFRDELNTSVTYTTTGDILLLYIRFSDDRFTFTYNTIFEDEL